MSSKTAYLKSFRKSVATASLIVLAAVLTACGGGGGGGGNSTPPPPATYTIGGTVSGLAGSGLVLQDNGGDNLTVSAGATTFVFATAVKGGGAYAVTVLTQPTNPAQTCTVSGGSGTVAASNVSNVSIACVTSTAQVGGTITGLAGTGLVLQDNGGDNLTVAANATTFTFATPVGVGAPFSVSVLTQPSNPPETCTVTGGSGNVVAGGVTSVVVTCAPATFTIGGTVTGLTGTGLILQNNAGDNLTVAPNATSFVFATPLQVGAGYAVSVATNPTSPSEVCTVGNGSGTVAAANVTTVTVSCTSVGRYVYVVNSIDGGAAGDVQAFSINATTGALTKIGTPITADNIPTGIAIDPVGQFAYVSNKNSADVTFFEINPDGSLAFHANFTSTLVGEGSIAVAPSNQYVFVGGYDGAGGAAWGASINAASGDLSFPSGGATLTADPLTSIAVDPSSSFVFATTFNSTSLYAFTIGTGGALTAAGNSPVGNARGGAVAVWPLGTASGGFVYTADNTTLRVSGFAYDSTGTLTPVPGSPFHTNGAQPAGIAVDPAGTYLYVTNFGDNSISSFSISATTGALTAVSLNTVATGNGPIDVKVDPSNQFLYVVNQTDGSVSQYTLSAGVPTLKNTYTTGTSAKAVALAIE